jgi:hypothetical protein
MKLHQFEFDFYSPRPRPASLPSCWQERRLREKYGLPLGVARIYLEQIMGHGGEVRHGR